MLRKDMIKQIKKWFKGFCKKYDPVAYCVDCGEDSHTCPLRGGGLGFSKAYPDDSEPLFSPSYKDRLKEDSYKIFKATKLHPAIPVENYQAFFVDCRTLSESETLDRIIDEVVGEYAEEIIQTADTEKLILEKRNRAIGADEVRKRLIRYTNSIEKKEEFNQYETI